MRESASFAICRLTRDSRYWHNGMQIRNFCIIAHIDHGKSTLADRLLELTHTIEARKMRAQILDQMDLERERGITIKMQPVRMKYVCRAEEYVLNLIDTPGHADFSYEVSRALAAVEGAILLVDATQGVQAQTIANLHLARRQGLQLIPAVNKVDVAGVDRDHSIRELADLLEMPQSEVLCVSGKTGEGVEQLLEKVIERIPGPSREKEAPLRALIFDSQFDPYKGVIAHVRIVSGALEKGTRIAFHQSKKAGEILELGYFLPDLRVTERLAAGEIGYIATGMKETGLRVGDTISRESDGKVQPLVGYEEPRPVVFASVYPAAADSFPALHDAILKLKLNDASLTYEIESSEALGRGFRMGFLGMLHLEIVTERLKREFSIEIVVSTPSVAYRLRLKNGKEVFAYSAADIPDAHEVDNLSEPWAILEVISPAEYLGRIVKFFETVRARFKETKYLSETRILITYEMPLKEIIVDLYDRLKSITSGYASMGYELRGYEKGDLVRLDILIADRRERAFSTVVTNSNAYDEGKRLVAKLKELLPSQVFAVPIQAAIEGRIIARETLKAMSKDVTGYLYGGDRTRKMKLWKKQKKGKERLKEQGMGRVEIPPDVFLKMLKR